MTEKRFSWEYSHYDSTSEIYDWKRKECLITDYLQKYEIEEWCQELNKICDENEQLKKENKELKSLCEDYRKLSIQYQQKYNEKISDNTFLEKENKELKSLCKVLITHIEKESIAFVIDEDIRRLLE